MTQIPPRGSMTCAIDGVSMLNTRAATWVSSNRRRYSVRRSPSPGLAAVRAWHYFIDLTWSSQDKAP
jgi:hypothetical protein